MNVLRVVPGLAVVLLIAPIASQAALRSNDQGISLALRGSVASAESVFTALVSASPRDPRALNNLGNAYLLGGDLDLALAFYNRAMKHDTLDAGIRLNRATVWLMMGDQDRAVIEAAEGVRRAGGEQKAAALLGFRAESAAPAAKAAQTAWVNKSEVRALIAQAAAKVPVVDTANARKARATETAARKPRWRSAGPRGAEGTDAATVLYWKH